jgi:hypothetical protein
MGTFLCNNKSCITCTAYGAKTHEQLPRQNCSVVAARKFAYRLELNDFRKMFTDHLIVIGFCVETQMGPH